jgi:hypothetical protein
MIYGGSAPGGSIVSIPQLKREVSSPATPPPFPDFVPADSALLAAVPVVVGYLLLL